ncbi:MAG: hypothetical protein IPF92_20055 [Myxococcales bacterium]|nr:hypothetical protein [Myxococcales bacterium]MBL0197087.1 hypothetical protein [Myxococcales bacterium]HQY63952.1 hypothetical protein [Polyangiaceae bacterium]
MAGPSAEKLCSTSTRAHLTNARATEMYVVLWARIYGATQNPMFNVKVVRAG